MTNRSIGTNGAQDPEADFTIRPGIGARTAVAIMARDGSVVANALSPAIELFISGAAAAGKSVYDQRTGMFVAGTLDQLTGLASLTAEVTGAEG